MHALIALTVLLVITELLIDEQAGNEVKLMLRHIVSNKNPPFAGMSHTCRKGLHITDINGNAVNVCYM